MNPPSPSTSKGPAPGFSKGVNDGLVAAACHFAGVLLLIASAAFAGALDRLGLPEDVDRLARALA